jgi:hypothetical protein
VLPAGTTTRLRAACRRAEKPALVNLASILATTYIIATNASFSASGWARIPAELDDSTDYVAQSGDIRDFIR